MAEKNSGRRPRSSLTTENILDAAEKVLVRGAESLTIRAVAVELQSSPMALYRYFTTKDELVDALLNRVLGRLIAPPPTGDWVERLRALAHAHRDLLAAHPWAIVPLLTHPNPGMNAARVGELFFGILAGGGVVGDDAVITFSSVLALNYGWSAFTAAREGMDADSKDLEDAMAGALMSLPIDMFPNTVAVARELAGYGGPRHYERALELLLSGIRARSE